MTPEGKVKKNLKDFLREYENLYSHWPVLNGMGAPELDCNITYFSRAISIECKSPGKNFTPRQCLTTTAKMESGGIVLGYRGKPDNETVEEVLDFICAGNYNSARKHAKAQLFSKGFLDA